MKVLAMEFIVVFGSETELEATPRKQEDPDSSLESYDGYGLTQEVNF